MQLKIFTFILVFLCALNADKVYAKPIKRTHSKPLVTHSMTADQWRTMMFKELPLAFCDTKEYFGFCFQIKGKTCQTEVRKIASDCFKQLSIPKNFNISTKGIQLGQTLGLCVGREFEKKMSAKQKKISLCTESYHWF